MGVGNPGERPLVDQGTAFNVPYFLVLVVSALGTLFLGNHVLLLSILVLILVARGLVSGILIVSYDVWSPKDRKRYKYIVVGLYPS
jgi:hypothetical protein